jgi:septal ring-binding cell division protein DamX
MGLERPRQNCALPFAATAAAPAIAAAGAPGPGATLRSGLSRKAILGLGVVPKAEPDPLFAAPAEPPRAIRLSPHVRLADLNANLHCSIVGTCLATAELRQLVDKLGLADAKALSEHELHKYGVTLAGQRGPNGRTEAAKLLQKLLDRKHRAVLNQFARAKTEAEVGALWDEAVQRGEIPGAYWAVLSHPKTGSALVQRVFGQVHMLSHLVGAANRADIRRLAALEAENVTLKEKLERQQAQIRDAAVAREARIRGLEMLLAQALAERGEPANDVAPAEERAALHDLVAKLERRLSGEAARRRQVEARLSASEAERQAAYRAQATAERHAAKLTAELAATERLLAGSLAANSPDRGGSLMDRTLLYVGGQSGHVAALREAAARCGATLLHHDGGIEDRTPLLAGLISRADAVLFPVDCISHDAMHSLKRLSRQAGKPYRPLRSAGLGAFLAALQDFSAAPTATTPRHRVAAAAQAAF